jgi:uncharacterized protein (DUF4415 family)
MNANTTLPISDDLDEVPAWKAGDFKTAHYRVGLKPAPLKKLKINNALDPDVVSWFKQQAGGRGYQTLINAALREVMQGRSIEDGLRRVIREEMRSH